jgi:hypothetical protein
MAERSYLNLEVCTSARAALVTRQILQGATVKAKVKIMSQFWSGTLTDDVISSVDSSLTSSYHSNAFVNANVSLCKA